MSILRNRVTITLLILILVFIGYLLFKKNTLDFLTVSDVFLDDFDFNSPTKRFTLSAELLEISCISYLGDGNLACIQDELASIYIYNLDTQSVADTLDLGEEGDYEDITYANNYLYLLRSDGHLLEVNMRNREVTKYDLDTGANNNEGLTFDKQTNSLLVTTKSKAGKGKDFKDKRLVFSFNLLTKELNKSPLLEIDISSIKEYFEGDDLEIKFRPSAIAVHPDTNNVFIVSAVDRILVEFDRNGKIINFVKLADKLFNQPEGLAFLDSETLLISNEGGNETSDILEFRSL